MPRAEPRLRKRTIRMLVGLGAMLILVAGVAAGVRFAGWSSVLFGYSMLITITGGGIMLGNYITRVVERSERRTRQKILTGFEKLYEVLKQPESKRDWDSTFNEIRKNFS